jgi:hypothetical protein
MSNAEVSAKAYSSGVCRACPEKSLAWGEMKKLLPDFRKSFCRPQVDLRWY